MVGFDCFDDLLRSDVPDVQLARLVACDENEAVRVEFHRSNLIIRWNAKREEWLIPALIDVEEAPFVGIILPLFFIQEGAIAL